MSRFALPRPIAFILGGGGSLGSVQVWMLQALARQHVVRDLVVDIPGIFPAVTVERRRLYDGIVIANVPVTQALEMGHRLTPLRLTRSERAARKSTRAISPVNGPA
jgi:predicted acylesterase/phospholipase RssA